MGITVAYMLMLGSYVQTQPNETKYSHFLLHRRRNTSMISYVQNNLINSFGISPSNKCTKKKYINN